MTEYNQDDPCITRSLLAESSDMNLDRTDGHMLPPCTSLDHVEAIAHPSPSDRVQDWMDRREMGIIGS